MLLLALGCFLVIGVAAASILARDTVPVLQSAESSVSVAAAADVPYSNKEAKKDKLVVAALAAVQPRQVLPLKPAQPPLTEPLRQAFAADSPVEAMAPDLTSAVAIPPKPKLAAKPPVQKTYALLSDAQIAAIRGRLNLSAGQESYWPPVEDALRRVAKKIHDQRQAKPNASGPPIDPDSEEVQQLKSAAMPLLFQLREDQKREVRSLARIIGLEAVASAI